LRSCGDLTTAVRRGQEARVAALAAAGAPLDARGPVMGLTALHVAVITGRVPLVKLLLELGANPNVLGDRDASALTTAVVHSAPLEVLDLLVQHGAAPATPNADGFGMLHAIAETDHTQYLPWAIAQRLDLEARTRHGHTPLHVAAGLGHVAALRALIAAGADRQARSPTGQTAHDIAVAEGKPDAAKALEPGS
jgi:ankyrin repeat protein